MCRLIRHCICCQTLLWSFIVVRENCLADYCEYNFTLIIQQVWSNRLYWNIPWCHQASYFLVRALLRRSHVSPYGSVRLQYTEPFMSGMESDGAQLITWELAQEAMRWRCDESWTGSGQSAVLRKDQEKEFLNSLLWQHWKNLLIVRVTNVVDNSCF